MRAQWYRDECSRCGRWVPRSELLRQIQRYTLSAGQNRFAHSSYDGTWWTSTATDAGLTAMVGASSYYQPTEDSNGDPDLTAYGVQAWQGDGAITSTAVDMSSWDSVVAELEIGVHQEDAGPVTLEIQIGGVTRKTWTVAGGRRCWATVLTSALAAPAATTVSFSVTTPTGEERWYVRGFQLYADLTEPPRLLNRIGTSGAAVVRASNEVGTSARVVCRRCRRVKPLDIIVDRDTDEPTPPTVAENLEIE